MKCNASFKEKCMERITVAVLFLYRLPAALAGNMALPRSRLVKAKPAE